MNERPKKTGQKEMIPLEHCESPMQFVTGARTYPESNAAVSQVIMLCTVCNSQHLCRLQVQSGGVYLQVSWMGSAATAERQADFRRRKRAEMF